ncbi:hypothetical protein MARI_10750 [Marinobacter sp. JH2]|nr:hypothetical protein MARI_10750 [Marinobacter sp. JH2]
MSLTLLKGMSLIDLFSSEKEGLTPTLVEKSTGISRAAARRFLLTFKSLGYLDQIDDKFFLTAKWLEISGKYLNQNPILDVLSKEIVNLSQEIDLPVSIVTLQGGNVMFLCRSPLRRVYASKLAIGDLIPAHASAGGKLILANEADENIESWIAEHGLKKITENTIVNSDTFSQECKKIRDRGYATSYGELEIGMISFSLPIFIENHTKMAVVISSKAHGDMREIDDELISYVEKKVSEIKEIYTNYLHHGG